MQQTHTAVDLKMRESCSDGTVSTVNGSPSPLITEIPPISADETASQPDFSAAAGLDFALSRRFIFINSQLSHALNALLRRNNTATQVPRRDYFATNEIHRREPVT